MPFYLLFNLGIPEYFNTCHFATVQTLCIPGFDVNFYAGVLLLALSKQFCLHHGGHLEEHLKRSNRVVHRVRGDELCFINAIAMCLQEDHNISIQISETINIILQHLAEKHQDYVHFHVVPDMSSQDGVSKSDLLLNDAMDFFQNRNYNKDIVDLLVTITADALGLDLYIYQNNQGKIQVLKYSGGPISKPIYQKFPHNDLNPVENHYDAIIKNQVFIENCDEIIQIKNTVATQSMEDEKKPSSNICNKQVFSFPTSNTKVINHQEVNTTIGQGKITNEQIFNNDVKHI